MEWFSPYYFKIIPVYTLHMVIIFQTRGGHVNWKIGYSLVFWTPVRSLNRERKRAGERGGSAWRGGRGRLARRRPCVRWRQAAFSHSLNRGTELGPSTSYLVPYASCPALLCLVLPCLALSCLALFCLASLACCDFLAPVLLSAHSE